MSYDIGKQICPLNFQIPKTENLSLLTSYDTGKQICPLNFQIPKT